MAAARGGGPPHAATPPASTMTSVIAANHGPRRSGPVRSGRGPLAAWKCPARTGYPFPGGRGIREATTISVYITVCTLSEFGLERQNSVFRRLVTTSAVVIGAALVATGCSPVKLGAAAIVGNERITIATLDTEATNLSRTAKLYPATVQLSQVQETQQTLTWLIRFMINDELARQTGITVSTAQAQSALDAIYTQAEAERAGPGYFQRQPGPHPGRQRDPAESARRGRPVPGHRRPVPAAGQRGTGPPGTPAGYAAAAKLTKARCVAAKP